MIIMMSKIFRCPICRSCLVNVTPIIDMDLLIPIGYEGYCGSLKCKAYKITFDKQFNVVGVRRFRDINTKRRVVARILEQNWDKYSYKTKKKLWRKYERAKKYL